MTSYSHLYEKLGGNEANEIAKDEQQKVKKFLAVKGNNKIPMIYYKDLISIIRYLILENSYNIYYYFACDNSINLKQN